MAGRVIDVDAFRLEGKLEGFGPGRITHSVATESTSASLENCRTVWMRWKGGLVRHEPYGWVDSVVISTGNLRCGNR